MEDIDIVRQVLLKNHLSDSLEITRYQSGFANKVYAAGDSHVVKLERNFEGILAHQKQISDKLVSAGAKVPRILDSGDIDGKPYLLMERLRGCNLVYDWLKFSMKQKESFIAQIAEQLQKFHSIRFDEYLIGTSSEKTFLNLRNAIEWVVDFRTIDKDRLEIKQREAIDFLEEFYKKHLSILDEESTAVLVHNDLNLENIFYEGEEITGIIDFDWASQAPKDYELWKIVEVFRYPLYTVEERLEPLYEDYKMTKEFGFLVKHYPTLFEVPKLASRIRLYYLEKIIDRVVDYQSGKSGERAMKIFQEEFLDLFKTDWLDRLVMS